MGKICWAQMTSRVGSPSAAEGAVNRAAAVGLTHGVVSAHRCNGVEDRNLGAPLAAATALITTVAGTKQRLPTWYRCCTNCSVTRLPVQDANSKAANISSSNTGNRAAPDPGKSHSLHRPLEVAVRLGPLGAWE